MVTDFRNMPFEDGTFSMVVFDPPHFMGLGEKSWLRKKYGTLDKETWQEDIAAGFSECFRVLKNEGVLIFKWNEFQIPLRTVLALTDQQPVFGHPSGKQMKTHWVAFMKQQVENKGRLF
jgi:ubiquinone/menaquinone biosynthesis C-methylase UbiE